jgi:hypothetical protein
MHLDGRQRRDLERVMDRPRIVRPGAGVEDDPVRHPLQSVQVVHELALGVGLEEAQRKPQLVCVLADTQLQLGQRQRAVVHLRATTKHVHVDPVHDLDSVLDRHRSLLVGLP